MAKDGLNAKSVVALLALYVQVVSLQVQVTKSVILVRVLERNYVLNVPERDIIYAENAKGLASFGSLKSRIFNLL